MWKSVEAKHQTPGSFVQQFFDGPNGPFFAVVFLIALALAIGLMFRRRTSRPRRTWQKPSYRPKSGAHLNAVTSLDPTLPTNQMTIVNQASFKKIRLLNKEESRILPIIERACRDLDCGYRVMAQTSLGELLTVTAQNQTIAKAAFASINSKRLDIAVIDRQGYLAAAVEYQGTGHHQNGAFIRDAVKREALRKAGITLIEVLPSDDAEHIQSMLIRQLDAPKDKGTKQVS